MGHGLHDDHTIVDYIIHRHAGGRLAVRPDAPAFATYLYWLHFAEGSLMTLMLTALALSRTPGAKESRVWARANDRLKEMLSFVDAHLATHEHFAGPEFTAADMMMVFPFTTLRHFLEFDLTPHANILAYLKRLSETACAQGLPKVLFAHPRSAERPRFVNSIPQ